MTKDTQLSKIIKAYAGASLFVTIIGEGVAQYGNSAGWWDINGWTPIYAGLVAPALPPAFNLFTRLAELTASNQQRGPIYSGSRPIPVNANGKPWGNLFMSVIPWRVKDAGRVINYKEPPERQPFEFWEERLSTPVSDDRLYQFCKMAWRRQQLVRFGKLTANQIFSRNYFTGPARPRFPFAEYQSIMKLLEICNLFRARWQGHGGELRYPPGLTIEEARRRWGYPILRAS